MNWELRDARDRDPAIQRGMDMLGEAMRRQRIRSRMTQRELAVLSGVDQSTISKFENGRRCGIRWTRFAIVVGVLGGLDFGGQTAAYGAAHGLPARNPYLVRLEAERAERERAEAEAATETDADAEDEDAASEGAASEGAESERGGA